CDYCVCDNLVRICSAASDGEHAAPGCAPAHSRICAANGLQLQSRRDYCVSIARFNLRRASGRGSYVVVAAAHDGVHIDAHIEGCGGSAASVVGYTCGHREI